MQTLRVFFIVFFISVMTCTSLSFASTPFNTIANSGYETLYSDDGQLLISNADTSIKFFDATTGKLRKNIKVKSLPPLRSGQHYIEYRPDYSFGLFEVATGKLVSNFPGFSKYRFTEKEQSFYFGDAIDKRMKDKRKRWGNQLKQTHTVVLTPDGETIAACSKSDNFRLKIWNVNSAQLIGVIDLYNAGKSKGARRMRRSAECRSLTSAPDGSYFFINDSRGGMYLVDAKTGKFLGKPLSTEIGITASALTDRGKSLVAINNNGRIFIWDIKNEKVIDEFETGEYDIKQLSATINGNHIAYVKGGKLVIWNIKTAKRIQTYSMFDTDVTYRTFSISFSPDGFFVATTDSANASLVPQIKIWDVSGKVTVQKNEAVTKGWNRI